MPSNDPTQPDYEQVVLALVRKYGTVTANQIASITKRKHETAARMLRILTETNKVYCDRKGKTSYFTLRTDVSTPNRVRPDRRKTPKKEGENNEGCGRGSVDGLERARTPLEIYPREGFVLHPSVKGSDVGREWVRFHVNGQYVVPIEKEGNFVSYFPDSDRSIEWNTSYLQTQPVYNGNVFLHNGDAYAFSVRMVTTKHHRIDNIVVYVHPRLIYYKNHETYGPAEMRKQVEDVLSVFESCGWKFKKENIELKGEYHTAINDEILGSQIPGKYIQYPDDKLHFDRSHGVPEGEVYGNDPLTVEMMVKLPDIIKAQSTAISNLNANMTQIIEIQEKLALSSVQMSSAQAQILSMLATNQPKAAEQYTPSKDNDRTGYQ